MAITKVTTAVTDFNSATESGLRLPSGTNSNQPTGVQGMLRNDTDEDGGSGALSALEHYNGTEWKAFISTESVDNPPVPRDNFDTVTYSGNNGSTSDTSLLFNPDLVWIKPTNVNVKHFLTDKVKGINSQLSSNDTALEFNTGEFTSFNSNGFTVTSNGTGLNASGSDYVAWCFKAGGLANRSSLFNGSSSYVNTSLVWPGNTTLSFSAWFKMDTINVSQYIIGDFNSAGSNSSTRFSISVTSTNLLQVGINNGSGGGSYPQFGSVASYINKWINVVVTVSGTEVKAYINGTQFGATTSQGTALAAGAQPFNVGAYGPGSNKQNFNGVISQVRFFTDVLTTGEVTQLYNETVANNSVLDYPAGTNCISAYPLGINANNLNNTNNGTPVSIIFNKPGYLTRNNDGTFESTVSVNNNLGFSIVTGSAGVNEYPNTFGHGLGKEPDIIITKLNNDPTGFNFGSSDWFSIFPKESNALLKLNTVGSFTYDSFFAGTSTTLKTGYTGAAFDFVAYCFASVAGNSKISSYTGNNGLNSISTGFLPRFLMVKSSSLSQNYSDWYMFDAVRGDNYLQANENLAGVASPTYNPTFYADGFRWEAGDNSGGWNAGSQTYIYLAFA